MIFAEMVYPNEYWDFHSELKAHVASNFEHWDSGLQSDSWFWIFDGDQKVAIDTFSSMKHQIKSSTPGPLVQRVIDALKIKYEVNVYAGLSLRGMRTAMSFEKSPPYARLGITVTCNWPTASPLPSLTGWSSRRPQAPLVGALRASHSGAAYRER